MPSWTPFLCVPPFFRLRLLLVCTRGVSGAADHGQVGDVADAGQGFAAKAKSANAA